MSSFKIIHPDTRYLLLFCHKIAVISNYNDSRNNDYICIIRGGGKKDIAKLNESVELEHAVKNSKIPIILDIGHKSDTMKFADYVAKECINPTEAAYFINERFMRLRSEKKMSVCKQYMV